MTQKLTQKDKDTRTALDIAFAVSIAAASKGIRPNTKSGKAALDDLADEVFETYQYVFDTVKQRIADGYY